ncbi:MAG TPA: hypothetical protein VEW48_03270 [Thermoanaerobaculia bacterium]|nr:hypothetical protein [Thermoanaerobaculia bacterium]
MPENTNPIVSIACICEKALQEKDGLISLIRVVDTLYLPRAYGTELYIVLALKSGAIRGKFDVDLVFRPPSGKDQLVYSWQFLLEGDGHGVNLLAPLSLIPPEEQGLSWFDVTCNGEVLTSIPFRLDVLEGVDSISDETSI